MRGIIGVSNEPFGDLSDSVEFNEANVADFLFSNSIARKPCKNPLNSSGK